MTHSRQNESEEMGIIAAPDAVIHPLTVMIASVDTIIALCESLVHAQYSHGKRCTPVYSDSTVENDMYGKLCNTSLSP
jgi:hypothetical protein